MKNLQLKTSIDKDMNFNFPVWYGNGTKEAMLMHMLAMLDAIKKHGHLKAYKEAQALYVEQKEVVKLAKASLSLLDGVSKGSGKSKKTLKKAKEAKGVTKVPGDPMQATFQVDLEKAKSATKKAKGAMTAGATQMFKFYANLLSVEAKLAWNKIVEEKTEGDPYVDLQCVSQSGPREMSRMLFNNCVLFHLLTVFLINAAEHKKYYIANVLKKPQRVNVCQFVWCVEQLSAYIPQMPCFYYTPSIHANTKPKNILFTEAELGSHVLRMCPIQWQDHTILTRRV